MSNISTEHWEDIIPDPNEQGEEAYLSFYEGLHEFTPSDEKDKWGLWYCTATIIRRGEKMMCKGSSHDSNHLPIDGCCHCKHGAYLHTSYDIPCGRCEMGDEFDYDEDEE